MFSRGGDARWVVATFSCEAGPPISDEKQQPQTILTYICMYMYNPCRGIVFHPSWAKVQEASDEGRVPRGFLHHADGSVADLKNNVLFRGTGQSNEVRTLCPDVRH